MVDLGDAPRSLPQERELSRVAPRRERAFGRTARAAAESETGHDPRRSPAREALPRAGRKFPAAKALLRAPGSTHPSLGSDPEQRARPRTKPAGCGAARIGQQVRSLPGNCRRRNHGASLGAKKTGPDRTRPLRTARKPLHAVRRGPPGPDASLAPRRRKVCASRAARATSRARWSRPFRNLRGFRRSGRVGRATCTAAA
jgi:hypothetical protein